MGKKRTELTPVDRNINRSPRHASVPPIVQRSELSWGGGCQKHNGRAAHVGARAELDAVTSEIMLIARQLDALNRFRSGMTPSR